MPTLNLAKATEFSDSEPLWEFMGNEGYRYVAYTRNRVVVYKGDSDVPCYEITESGCTCKAAQYGSACKHLGTVRWLGDGAGGSGTESNPTSQNDKKEEDEGSLNLL